MHSLPAKGQKGMHQRHTGHSHAHLEEQACTGAIMVGEHDILSCSGLQTPHCRQQLWPQMLQLKFYVFGVALNNCGTHL